MTEQKCDKLYCLNRKILEWSPTRMNFRVQRGDRGDRVGILSPQKAWQRRVSVYFPGCQNRFIFKLNNKSAGLLRTPQYAVTLSPTLHVHKCT